MDKSCAICFLISIFLEVNCKFIVFKEGQTISISALDWKKYIRILSGIQQISKIKYSSTKCIRLHCILFLSVLRFIFCSVVQKSFEKKLYLLRFRCFINIPMEYKLLKICLLTVYANFLGSYISYNNSTFAVRLLLNRQKRGKKVIIMEIRKQYHFSQGIQFKMACRSRNADTKLLPSRTFS